ncbi:Uncharacterized protein FWK35_00011770 [Aphis craccivora]|uniref:Uncharacterized protein n=1 Tax=Aphis craccivora TaxID=307492 RepID=A0A6G0ZA89_APHCR|nr:Uncharacterized protein FWK35_00011770 [Aphis craccivora]
MSLKRSGDRPYTHVTEWGVREIQDERKSRSRRGNTSFFLPPPLYVKKNRHSSSPRQAPHIRRPGRPLSRRRPALDKPGLRRRTEHAHALHSLPYAHLDDDGDDDYTTATATATCLATAAVCCFRGRVRTARRPYNTRISTFIITVSFIARPANVRHKHRTIIVRADLVFSAIEIKFSPLHLCSV